MSKKMIVAFLFLIKTQLVLSFDKKVCDQKESELKSLQKIIFGLKARGSTPFKVAQTLHDKDMAELIILKGIEELKERHQKFLRDMTDQDGKKIGKNLVTLNKVRGKLKDGIDSMGRMIVLQDMIENIIGLEKDLSGSQKRRLRVNSRKSPEEFKKLLANKCLSKTVRDKILKNKLCAILAPPKRADYEFIPKEEKKALKAKLKALNGFSPNIMDMIDGFSKAYLIRHGQAENDEQAKEERSKALLKYKQSLQNGFPKELSPQVLYDDAIKLESYSRITDSKEFKNLQNIKHMKKLSYSINKSIEKYKECLAKSHLDAMTSSEDLAQKKVCDLSIGKYQCETQDLRNCRQLKDKGVDFKSIQNSFNNFQKDISEKFSSGINRYVEASHENENENIDFKTEDIASEIDKLNLTKDSKDSIHKTIRRRGKKDKQFLNNQFPGFLSSLNIFSDRAKMMSNFFNQGGDKKSLNAKKVFLKALQKSGCLSSKYDLQNDLGIKNASQKVFSKFVASKTNVKGQVQYDSKSGQVQMNQKFLRSCLTDQEKNNSFNKRISELKDSIKARKNEMNKIKKTSHYKNLSELRSLAFQNYKKECKNSKSPNEGFQLIKRCHLNDYANKKNKELESFISHSGKILSVMSKDESVQLPFFRPSLRKHTKRMYNACKKWGKKIPLICHEAKTRHEVAMEKTKNENRRYFSSKYHYINDRDGKIDRESIEKRRPTSDYIYKGAGYFLTQYAVPTLLQSMQVSGMTDYNESRAYQIKYNQFVSNNSLFFQSSGGFFGNAGVYPFNSFGFGLGSSPYLGGPSGNYRFDYLNS